ncbi:MAG: AAA family ATPase [Clostridia bacterium]|nr:AAA family ATPase [Clostridia bacterium]MBP5459644.1 AAA family ATPase [Clostridia bacterium]
MSTEKKTTIVALVGKGGVGKTSLSALIVKLLAESHPDKKILAIDADPAVGLATALGVDVSSTVDDIRKSFVQTVEDGNTNAAIELLGEAKYQMFDALVELDNMSFLAIGRPESAGCYCKVNAYLKEIISAIADHFDYVVIDGEAGIEQVNRRVMEKVTHLVLVSDASRKGLQVVQTIHKVAEDLVMFDESGLIINRIPDISFRDQLDTGDLRVLACIPDDRTMALNDMNGDSVFDLPEDAAIVQGAREALKELGI